jgi:cobalt-precorrin-5B (C1)-methyltransferase
MGDDRLRGANTVLEAFEICGAPLADLIAVKAREQALSVGRDAGIDIDIVVIDRAGTILARTGA